MFPKSQQLEVSVTAVDSGRWQPVLGLILYAHWEAEQFVHTAPLAREDVPVILPYFQVPPLLRMAFT